LDAAKGGLTTKIHAVVDEFGNPLRFKLTGDQVHDCVPAKQLIEGLPAEYVVADKVYEAQCILTSFQEESTRKTRGRQTPL
jgi:transposase